MGIQKSLPIIQAGAGLFESVMNPILQGAQNRKMRKFAREMYGRQRADALADWHMQNEYNSPAAQMSRYKAAGLNAHLIYGQSNESGAIRSSSAATPTTKAPQVNATGALMGMYDLRIRDAQEENLRVQNDVLREDVKLKSIAAVNEILKGQTSKFDLDMKRQLADTVIEQAEANLRKTTADTQFTLDSNQRAAISQVYSIQEAISRLMTMEAERANTVAQKAVIEQTLENMKKDGTLKDLDIELRRLGIMPTDPLWARIIARVVGDPTKAAEKIRQMLPQTKEDYGREAGSSSDAIPRLRK